MPVALHPKIDEVEHGAVVPRPMSACSWPLMNCGDHQAALRGGGETFRLGFELPPYRLVDKIWLAHSSAVEKVSIDASATMGEGERARRSDVWEGGQLGVGTG